MRNVGCLSVKDCGTHLSRGNYVQLWSELPDPHLAISSVVLPQVAYSNKTNPLEKISCLP